MPKGELINRTHGRVGGVFQNSTTLATANGLGRVYFFAVLVAPGGLGLSLVPSKIEW